MKNQTNPTKANDIKRSWHLIDADNAILGRISTQVAEFLMGKSKPYFVRNLDCGDYVVVINAQTVKLTGNKESQKVYTRYSGYPGGLRKTTVKEMRAQQPEKIIHHAVAGMLPHNRLHDRMLKRLYVFAGSEHPYKDKLKVQSVRQAFTLTSHRNEQDKS